MSATKQGAIRHFIRAGVMLTRRVVAAGIASGCFASTALPISANDIVDRRFRDDVAALLTLKRPQWTLELPENFTEIRIDETRFFLGNVYRTVQEFAEAERELYILHFFDQLMVSQSSVKTDPEFALARPRLRVRVVPIDYHATEKTLSSPLLVRPFSSMVSIGYVLDADQVVRFVLEQHLGDWSADAATVHNVAVNNLDLISREIEIHAQIGASGHAQSVVLELGDSYDAARILAPEFMTRLRAALAAKIFVAIPNRDVLVAWAPDFSDRRRFAAIAKESLVNEPYPLSDELFVSTAEGIRLATAAELADHGR